MPPAAHLSLPRRPRRGPRRPGVLATLVGLLAGLLSAAAIAPAAAEPTAGVRITEWQYNGVEFFELTNLDDAPVDLTGWSYSDSVRTPAPAATSTSLTPFGVIAPGESVVVAEDPAAAFRAAWGIAPIVKVIGGATPSLGRNDEINVYDASGALVDRLTYNDAGTGSVAGPRTDTASAWVPASAVGRNDASAWTRSTPGDAEGSWTHSGGVFHGSPGSSSLGAGIGDAARALRITEFLYGDNEWFELTNLGAQPVDLSGWSFSDSVRTPAPAATSVSLSGAGVVRRGESVVVTQDGAGTFRAAWDLSTEVAVVGGSTVSLGRSDEINVYDGSGTLVDRLTYNDQGTGDVAGPRTNDSSAWPAPAAVGRNVAREWTLSTVGDVEGPWTRDGVAARLGTPGTTTLAGWAPGNRNPASAGELPEPVESDLDLVINEVKTNPNPDFVELKNVGTELIDVAGLMVADSAERPVTITTESTPLLPGELYAFDPNALPGGFGLGAADTATILEADGSTIVDSYRWTEHRVPSFGYCPDSPERVKNAVPTPGAENICVPVRINEVASAAGSAQDWVELKNVSDEPVDLTGWILRGDGDGDGDVLVLGPDVVLGSGEYRVLEGAALGFDLTAPGSLRLLRPDATTVVDEHSWSTHASTTYGRCADGVGGFVLTRSATKGAPNDCPPPFHGVETEPWPGGQEVVTSDPQNAFVSSVSSGDVSGLAFDPDEAGVLWAIKNKNRLFRLTAVDGLWRPVATDEWSTGKELRFADGRGEPDTEGVTVGPDGAVYATSERDNTASGVPRNTVLRYEPSGAGPLTATDEWSLDKDFPELANIPGGSNLGLEGLTWVPDEFLVDGGFVDQSTGTAYDPADYPGHGSGLFFLALENDGSIHAYALAADGKADRVARIPSGFARIADVTFDPDRGAVWGVTDDTHDGQSSILRIGPEGAFEVSTGYLRPAKAPNLNNEGFALAPADTCVDGLKEAIWADDGGTGGHSLRSGTIECVTPTDPDGPTDPVKVEPSITAARVSSTYGKRVTVVARVRAEGATPSGTVTARKGQATLGSATVKDGRAVITVPARSLRPGTHGLSLDYTGDASVASGRASVRVDVAKASSRVTAKRVSTKKVVLRRTAPAVRIAVAGSDKVPATGTVRVTVGKRVKTVRLENGVATVRMRPFGRTGAKKLTVRYSGSALLKPSSTTVSIRVVRR